MQNNRHFVFIPKVTLVSDEFKALKKHSRLLYVYMVARRAGVDDWFSYSYKEMRQDSGYRYGTISGCIKELSQAGLVQYKHGGLELNHNIYYLMPLPLQLV